MQDGRSKVYDEISKNPRRAASIEKRFLRNFLDSFKCFIDAETDVSENVIPSIAPSSTSTNSLFTSCPTKKESEYFLPLDGPLASIPNGAHVTGLVAGFQAWIAGFQNYETPTVLRFTYLIDSMDWNCAASYSHNWKDSLTKSDVLVRTPSSILIGQRSVPLHTSDTRLMCIISAWATVVKDWVPESYKPLISYINDFRYTGIGYGGYDPDINKCFDDEFDGKPNLQCLQKIAQDECYAPSVMGAIIGHQLAEYAKRDGWNMYGELRSDNSKCVHNCRRYTDPTNFSPSYDSQDVVKRTRWNPLLEDNNNGYFTRQEHVVPHIGILAKNSILSRADFESRNITAPLYDYNNEALLVSKRMSKLTDTKKILIEFFDNKILVALALIGTIAMQGVSFEQILHYSLGLTSGDYDATLLAWRAKVKTDLVRPTTWIQDQMSNVTFQTWVRNKGIQNITGKEFEAYLRVMPHAEFVSGSGCIFQSMYEYTDSWVKKYLNKTNSISVLIGNFPAGSSIVEPGKTPKENITIMTSNMLELRNLGGQSRLDGGMHFTQSVEASYELCKGVGLEAARYVFELWGP